jgi:hypothetical protein
MNLIKLMTVELQKINLHSVNGPALDVSFDEIIRLMWNEQSKIRLDCYLKKKNSKVYQMFTLFFPKKVAKKDLKIIIFLFDCFTTHNLTHIFLMRNETSKIRLDCYFWIQVFQKYIKCLRCFSSKKWQNRILKLTFFCLLAMTVFSTLEIKPCGLGSRILFLFVSRTGTVGWTEPWVKVPKCAIAV